MHSKQGGLDFLLKWSKAKHSVLIISVFIHLFMLRRSFTIEEDEEDAGVGELLSTQQVDVFYA